MLQPIVYLNDATKVLGEFYFRVLAAMGIIDGTLSVLTIIFYKLYMNKHPKVESVLLNSSENSVGSQEVKKKGLSIWVWILIVYLVFQIIAPLLFFASSFLY